ncbi:DUF4040 domain-containing protein [Kribbella sp. NPDC026611]|uniref:DUF4040 domain-containing protein n=1 Tax=Kribbella sp. NPDC026611 TaxID=3154911 RepID=UPI0033DCEFDE
MFCGAVLVIRHRNLAGAAIALSFVGTVLGLLFVVLGAPDHAHAARLTTHGAVVRHRDETSRAFMNVEMGTGLTPRAWCSRRLARGTPETAVGGCDRQGSPATAAHYYCLSGMAAVEEFVEPATAVAVCGDGAREDGGGDARTIW